MKIDVFVSYHTATAGSVAEAVVKMLEEQGLRCWYQARDTGGFYADAIKHAIDECCVFVIILSQGVSRSRHIRTEVSLAYDRDELEILPLRLADVKLSDALEYYLHGIHWIDAANRSLDVALEDLCTRALKAVDRIAPRSKNETVSYKDGSVYTGEVMEGKRHGKGKMTWPNGDVYEGDWREDRRTGKGKYYFSNGNVFEGDYVNGHKNGKGKFVWADGDIYEGDYLNGYKHGRGKYVWGKSSARAGDVYEGDFVNGERTGIGTYTYANGRVESGRFLKGVFQG